MLSGTESDHWSEGREISNQLSMTTTKCRNGFILPFEKIQQPLLICSDQFNGLAFGWTCAPNGSEVKIVCANGMRVPTEEAALFALAGEQS